MYDEKTGEPRETRGKLLPRVKPPPCVTHSCPKGHYNNPIKLGPRGIALVNLYEAVQATGGACLTQAEREDSFCCYALARVKMLYDSRDSQRLASQIATAISPIILGGTGGKRR